MTRISLALLLLAGSAAAEPRLSPRVRMVAHQLLPSHAIAAPGGTDDRAVVTVQLDPSASGASATSAAATLASAGFDARPLTATLVEVHASAAELAALIAQPGVRAVEERRVLHTLLDQSGPAIRAPQARQESGLDGTGILLGFVDTGADVRHADLRNADGSSRVQALIDFSQPADSRHPELGPLRGPVWLKSEIDAALAAEAAGMTPMVPVTEKDVDGHGTHVAATSTSNGLATGNGFPAGRYVGMAPGAEIVVAQATHGGHTFTDDDVIAALGWVADMATRLQRPLVLNLSLGGSGGPHDGTASLERAIDDLFPADMPGRIAVLAAGNDGTQDLHASASLIDGEVVFSLELATYTDSDGVVDLELWYTGSLELSVETPGGFQTDWIGPGGSLSSDQVITNHIAEGKVVVTNDATPQDNGRRSAGVALVGPMAASPVAGTWKIHVRGQAARFDAWSVESPSSGAPARFTDHITVDERIGLPATAHNVITVGSFATKNTWMTNDGQTIQRNLVLGNPSSFSSTGPTIDGRFAPDLLAPGEFIMAALSSATSPNDPSSAFYVPGHPNYTWADDGVHAALRGTSQAAPHVAGACALLLQADPTLTLTSMRELLRVTARPTPVGWSTREGFGKLDVLSALHYLRGQRGTTLDANQSSVGSSRDLVAPGEDTFTVTAIPRDGDGVALGAGHAVTIEASEGQALGDVVDTGWGRYERTFVAHAPRGTAAHVTVTVDEVALAAQPTIYFVVDRSEIGQPFVAGGGCELDRRPSDGLALAGVAVLLGLAWMVRKSRRRPARSTLES
jgi:subtilisin family serine protease